MNEQFDKFCAIYIEFTTKYVYINLIIKPVQDEYFLESLCFGILFSEIFSVGSSVLFYLTISDSVMHFTSHDTATIFNSFSVI